MKTSLLALFAGAVLATPSLGLAQVPLTATRNDPQGNVTLLADPRLLPAGAPRPAPSPSARAAAELRAQQFQAPGSLLEFTSGLHNARQVRGAAFQPNSGKWYLGPSSQPAAESQSLEFDRLTAEREAVLSRKRELEQQARALDAEVQRLDALLLDAVRPAPAAK
jgi:hypothetical protein